MSTDSRGKKLMTKESLHRGTWKKQMMRAMIKLILIREKEQSPKKSSVWELK